MNGRLLTAVAVLSTPLLWASPASAGLLLEYSTNGGSSYTTLCSAASGGTCTDTGPTALGNGLNVSGAAAQSNSPGTAAQADLFSSTVSITNTNSSGTASVILLIGDINFTGPTAPPGLTLSSDIGGSVNTGASADTLSYISCVDLGNGQDNCSGTLNTAPVTPSITASNSNYSAGDDLSITSLTAPFSMTEEVEVTLGAGAKFNYSATSDLTPIPEPASLTLLGSALIGLGALRRRRRKRV